MPPIAPTVPRQREPEHSQEWDLVDRAADGDGDAFAELYKAHQAQVHRYLFNRTNNAATADELTNVVFTRAYQTLARVQYQGQGYGAWLHRIAVTVAIDHHKSKHSKSTFLVGDWYEFELIDPTEEPYMEAVRTQEALELRGAMQRLTEEQRQVLELRFLADLSVEETAIQLGINVGAVKARQMRACRALLRDPAIQALGPRRDT